MKVAVYFWLDRDVEPAVFCNEVADACIKADLLRPGDGVGPGLEPLFVVDEED